MLVHVGEVPFPVGIAIVGAGEDAAVGICRALFCVVVCADPTDAVESPAFGVCVDHCTSPGCCDPLVLEDVLIDNVLLDVAAAVFAPPVLASGTLVVTLLPLDANVDVEKVVGPVEAASIAHRATPSWWIAVESRLPKPLVRLTWTQDHALSPAQSLPKRVSHAHSEV